MLCLLTQSATTSPQVATMDPIIAPVVNEAVTTSSDLLSVIGRVDLMISIIGVFSTILLFILGYLVWRNYEAKNKFDNEVREITKIRKNLEKFYSSMYELIKQFSQILNAFEESLSKSADHAKLLKQVVKEVEKSAKETKAPAPQIKSIADAQEAIGESFDQLQAYAGTATAIREAMQPDIDALERYYAKIASEMSQIPTEAMREEMKKMDKVAQKVAEMVVSGKTENKKKKK